MAREPKSEEIQEVAAPAPAAVPAAPKPVPVLVTFEQWAARRCKKTHHLRGLKAQAKTPEFPRTMEAWDKLLA